MAVSSCVICVEGVLQKNVSYAPIPTGIALYHSLASVFNVLLVSDSTHKELDYWLALEGLNRHSAVECNEGLRTFMDEDQRKLHEVNALRIRRYSIDLVVDPNPASSALLLVNGYSVLTFTHSSYALPQWRPDYQEVVKPWEELEKHVTLMAQLRAVDERLKDKDTFS